MSRRYSYLEEYIQRLAEINKPGQIYGELTDWQHRERRRVKSMVEALNEDLGLTRGTVKAQTEGDSGHPIDLRFKDHIPTTAVGRLDGIVVVAVNPGYRDRLNKREDAYRAEIERNRAFCENFFDVYPRDAAVGTTSTWWTKAIKLAGVVNGNEDYVRLGGKNLWRRAHEDRLALGGIDLVPFHSSRDGFSQKLVSDGNRGAALPLLRTCAIASLEMAVRLNPKLILVTSHAGCALFIAIFGNRVELVPPKSWSRPTKCMDYTEKATLYFEKRTKQKILCYPRQIFSGTARLPAESLNSWIKPVVKAAYDL